MLKNEYLFAKIGVDTAENSLKITYFADHSLKFPLFGSSSLKHIRWRFRTCVSCRVSVKRYAQNKTLRRCASMHNKWYYSSFEILHNLLPSIFVLVFCQGCPTGSQTVVGLTLRMFVCFSSKFSKILVLKIKENVLKFKFSFSFFLQK